MATPTNADDSQATESVEDAARLADQPAAPGGKALPDRGSERGSPLAVDNGAVPAEDRPSRHGIAKVLLAVAAILAVLAWLLVGVLAFLAVESRRSPEGMLGFSVALSMPFVLVPALGFTAAVAFLYHSIWGGRAASVIGTVTAAAAAVAPCAWFGGVVAL